MKKNRYYFLRKDIDCQSPSFFLYLETFLPPAITKLMKNLSEQTQVYVFSGVIKNFLLGLLEHRDLDLVVSCEKNLNVHVRKLLCLGLAEIKRNKFDGLKLVLDGMDVDIWRIERTKGLVDKQLAPTPENLIKTSFFNFSAIVYDYNHRRFIYGADFCRFLQYRELDVVCEENPFVESCIVSTFYYAEKYELSISNKLCRWIGFRYQNGMDFREVQLRRFGKECYTKSVINSICEALLLNPGARITKINRIGKQIEVNFTD